MQRNEAEWVHYEDEVESEEGEQRPYEVLVVDDDPDVLSVVSLAMEMIGYSVTSADSGASALEMLRSKHFDLLLTDLMMDEMDGIALLKRSKDLYPETKVVLMTGYYDPDLLMHAVQHQADGYILKPFSIEALRLKLASCLERDIH